MGFAFFANPTHKLEKVWEINEIQNSLHKLKVFRENCNNEKTLVINAIQLAKDDLARAEFRIELYRWVILLNKVLETTDGVLPDTNIELNPPIKADHKELFALVIGGEDFDGEYRQIVREIKAKHLNRINITDAIEVQKMDLAKSEAQLEKYLKIKHKDLNSIAAYEAQLILADQVIAGLDEKIHYKTLELQLKGFFFTQEYAALQQGSGSQQECGKEEYLKYTQKYP